MFPEVSKNYSPNRAKFAKPSLKTVPKPCQVSKNRTENRPKSPLNVE